MGVPKFFRYISERYPNLSELIGSAELPQFDNMYLDMNGIIHTCSHPDDSNVHFRMSEEQMFRDILHYIDTIFHMIKPNKLFFMAVDGVAPRAKMNQQRSRRFQSARTAAELIEKAKKANEKLPEESRFDSNCITPGTEFMERLQQAFKHFVKLKLSTDPAWKHCRVILSGHETPGEGEHKIMEYIRYLKSKPDYDSNTRHCLYGLDADLMMLGLCTHELNFALLREEVKFDKNAKRAPSVDETKFYLLHLGLLRDYLELEFIELKPILTFEYDLEKIIDDWVFMCFMVGNDFLPHLPNLHINSNALPILYKVYKSVLPKLDGYLNEAGKLNLSRFEVFMEEMSEVDRVLFREKYEDLKYMETKYNNDETFANNATEITAETKSDLDDLIKQTNLDFGSDESDSSDLESGDSDQDLMFAGQDPKEIFKDCEDEEEEELSDDDLFEREFTLHKRDYYINKLKYPEMNEDVLAEQTKCYITALQWTLSYYYRGVCSWSWYYPHHYAPYMSDIKNFKDLQLQFKMGKPFLPFEQLLSVLPAASMELLPSVYHKLMTDPSSKIIDYYPVDFETDLNGKKQEWEALVLIPFINELRLMDAMNDCNDRLSSNEQSRNKHGPMLQFDYCATDLGSEPECLGQQMIGHVFCMETKIDRSELLVPEDKLVLGPCSGAQKDVYFPGFPTMRHLKHSGKLEMKRVKVFHQPTRNESMIIRIDETPPEEDLLALAKHFMDKEVYIGWPHLREAKVCAVSDVKAKIEKTGIEYFKEGNGNMEFKLLSKHVKDHHLTRLGMDLGDIEQLLHVYPLLNREYLDTGDGKLTLAKNWSKIPLAVARTTVIEHLVVFAKELEKFKRVEDVFTKGSTVFLKNKGYYGCEATIADSKFYNGRIKLSALAHPQPDFSRVLKAHQEELQNYMNSYTASSAVGISAHLFNRITGVVFVYCGEKRYPISDFDKKVNIGLQLKHFKQNEEVPGFTKNVNNHWVYSQKAVNLVHEYSMKFPRLFQLMNRQSNAQTDPLFESQLCEGQKEGEDSVLKKIQQWLNESPIKSVSRQPCGTECLSKQSIEHVSKTVESLENGPVRMVSLQVKPHLLYKPNLNDINVLPDPSATFELFDRVVIVRDQYSVPLGLRGTIISILPRIDPNPIRQENISVVDHIYEILFDKPFELGTSIPDVAEKRVFKVRKSVLMNITHGAGRPTKERSKFNGNDARQKNGTVNEPPQPNAWRIPLKSFDDKKPILRSDNVEKKSNENAVNVMISKNNVDVSSNEMPTTKQAPKEVGELVNLAHKVNIAERLKKQKENEVATEADILKKMLRVGQNSTIIAEPTAQPLNNAQPIDLNSLFGKASISDQGPIFPNPANLPKPPKSWQQKSKDKEPVFASPIRPQQQPLPQHQPQPLPQSQPPFFPNNHMMNVMGQSLQYRPQFFPQQQHQHPNMPPNMMPYQQHMMSPMYRPPPQMFIPSQNYPMQMMHQGHMMPSSQPFMQAPHHIRMQGPPPHFDGMQSNPSPVMHSSPEGPQKLKTMSGTASAFIPLQAARKNIKSSKNSSNKTAANDFMNNETILDKPTEDDSKHIEQVDIQPSVSAQTATQSPVKTTKPLENKSKDTKKDAAKLNDKPLPKRLAANFSVKPTAAPEEN